MGIWSGAGNGQSELHPVPSGGHCGLQQPVDLAYVTSTFTLRKGHQISANTRLERRYDQSETCVMDAKNAFRLGMAAQSPEPFPFYWCF